eukprot:GHVP01001218.1.p1 GENE.GHVP01001218.1~~GHVP01001218.1.p1  ORF type:complete len:226 (-),score=34.15 GHVP01001218.1:1572-2249(-)
MQRLEKSTHRDILRKITKITEDVMDDKNNKNGKTSTKDFIKSVKEVTKCLLKVNCKVKNAPDVLFSISHNLLCCLSLSRESLDISSSLTYLKILNKISKHGNRLIVLGFEYISRLDFIESSKMDKDRKIEKVGKLIKSVAVHLETVSRYGIFPEYAIPILKKLKDRMVQNTSILFYSKSVILDLKKSIKTLSADIINNREKEDSCFIDSGYCKNQECEKHNLFIL